MLKKTCSFAFALLAIAMTACNSPSSAGLIASTAVPGPVMPMGEQEIRDLAPTTETVWNCGSGGGTIVKHPAMSVVTNHTVEWQIGGTSGVGVTVGQGVIPGGVDLSTSLEGRFSTSFDQGVQQGTGWDLPAESNSIVVYTLMWHEIWQPGYVDVRLADQSVARVNVRYRVGIQSEIVGKQEQKCDTGQPPSVVIQPTSRPAPTAKSDQAQYQSEVFASKGWQDTGVTVRQGSKLIITVINGQWTSTVGKVSYNPGLGWSYTCANAMPASQCVEPLPESPQGALIGRIGSRIFGIGQGITVMSGDTGPLSLRINDGDGDLYDNDGRLIVQITVEP